jgi:hypothetical protein
MSYIPSQQQDQGSYIPTTGIFEIAKIYEADVNSDEFKELLARLYQSVNNIANVLNLKDTGYYLTSEFVTGALWFNPASSDPLQLRPAYRLVVDMGPLNPSSTKAHGLPITSTWSFVKIYGVANDNIGFNYYPIPWVAAGGGANNIELEVNGTNVVVTNNTGIAFSSCYVVLEYLKN